ncbi:class I SAM-dependent methyltransferase [Actinophytocola algeriensis]|uniref:SAM-dependent methyltransferase n=1 Tax=Actinophytocola algeriensis TaxID=1768010 RepID=A0A7W7VGG3_9PSEU|nr:class I SAM-dependent methyltransferase [Actinophytocola algeriensis]MBB4909313.1 SAM-dependent methyltransferase [Actinophytocola algeriensis]MBE1475303.1 SAM-dependent methyltransferase [Actinophytocola algeriensis]
MSDFDHPKAEEFAKLRAAIVDEPIRELFPFRFLAANENFSRLVDATAHRILSSIGALPATNGISVQQAKKDLSIPWRRTIPLKFLYEKLTIAGIFEREGTRYYPGALKEPDFETVAAELAEREPGVAVAADILRTLIEEAKTFFAGEATGDEILFAPSKLPLWLKYFHNDNLLYAINNTVGAEAVSRLAPAGGGPFEVLEIGGGCGSAAEYVLRKLGPAVTRYRFTEVAETFARHGERAVAAAADPSTTIESARVDMTQSWEEQGVEPGTFDVVYSVNCFHVAPDLDFVIREAAKALKPGGTVVVSECIRPTKLARPIHAEIIFDFLDSFTDVATDPVRRPTHGFLTPAAWRATFEAAGLGDVKVVPDVDGIAEQYPDFVVGAVMAKAKG